MSGKGSISLYINDPEVSNELEYLNWSLEQQKFRPDPENQFIVSFYGDQFILSEAEAKNLTSQYRKGNFSLKFNHSYIKEFPLMTAIEMIGMERLYGEFKVHELFNMPMEDLNVDGVAQALASMNATGSSLFQLETFLGALDTHALDRQEFASFIPRLIQYDLLDDATEFLYNNANRSLRYYSIEEKEVVERPLAAQDLKGGLLVLITITQFRELLERHSKQPIEQLKQTYPEIGVVDMVEHFVSGKVQVGICKEGVSKVAGASYSHKANSICLRDIDEDVSKYGVHEEVDENGGRTTYVYLPTKIVIIHESTHAFQDKNENSERAGTRVEHETGAWNIQSLYERFTVREDQIDKLDEALKKTASSQGEKISRRFGHISFKTGSKNLEKHFSPAVQGVAAHAWAKDFLALIQKDEQIPHYVMEKMNKRSLDGYVNTMLTAVLDRMLANKSVITTLKKVVKYDPSKRIKLFDISETGEKSSSDVIIRSKSSRKAWFERNRPKVKQAADYLDSLTLQGSDLEIRRNLRDYSVTVLTFIGLENAEKTLDHDTISELTEHFVFVVKRLATQSVMTPLEDRGI